MKTDSLHPLLTMKRPYQILTKAVITAFVVTAIPSFAAPLPVAVPATEIPLNYVSPLMKAIQLENELERSAKSPVEVEIPPLLARPKNCINGSVAFNTASFTNGWEFKPYPYLLITLGKVQGSVTAWGQYCFDGKWVANGTLAGTVKNEILVGLNTGNWRYFDNNNFRYKFGFGLKGEANLVATGRFDFNASSQSYESAILNLNVRGDLIGSLVTPKVTIERWKYNGATGSFSWIQLDIAGPTNGAYVDGLSFEASAYGSVTFTGGYYWQVWDNDPDSRRNSENQRWGGKITGRMGVKLKYKKTNGSEYETNFSWSQPLVGNGLPVSGNKHVAVDDTTDHHLDQRPR